MFLKQLHSYNKQLTTINNKYITNRYMNKPDITKRINSAVLDYLYTVIISLPVCFLIFLLLWGKENDLLIRVIMISFFFSAFLCKDLKNGQSMGRKSTSIRVVGINEENASYLSLILRNIFIFIWPIEILILLLNPQKRRIGDLVFKTKVIQYKPTEKQKTNWVTLFLLFCIVFVFVFLVLYSLAIYLYNNNPMIRLLYS